MAWSSTEQAYWDGFTHSMTFGVVDEEIHGREYGTPSSNAESSAYWMGVTAGTITFSGAYAAVQMSPWLVGTAASEGTFLSHLGIIGMELGLAPFAPPLLVLAAAAALAEAGLTLGLGDYRERMAEHKSYYNPLTQRKMR